MKPSDFPGIIAPLALCALLAACASHNAEQAPATTGTGGYYKIGQPYEVNGQWYYPHEDYSYDETGIASWYGADFHEQSTANGEIYNKNELTAAHKTLPLPSLARVTNLENGRSIVVRINDRGPFSGARIIDVSQRAAQLLGFEANGTAKVRVQVLADESKAIADAMRRYGRPAEVASAAPVETAASSQPPLTVANAPVQTEVLHPVRTTPQTHRELERTQPVPYVLQLPVTGNNRIYVQAGAFTVAENATKLQRSLERFSPSSVSKIVINGTTFYRVRLGPIADVAHADALLSKVRHTGVTGARTVVD
ncbi:MAG: septal ring lytic transglycosylase RlpA family protein [Alphaproteobacteria bacterium]|nr:septal ring lytic transglycosylase RlpA family protein [Alphaproteobacteria bacterium]